MKLISLLLVLFPLAASASFHGGVSYVHSQIAYKEAGIMSEKGTLRGVALDGRYNLSEQLAIFAQAKFLGGHLEYDGRTFGGTPLSQTTDDTIREYRAVLSYKLGQFSPYAGYAYRYWRNDLVISYVRDTTYYYFPVGLRYTLLPFYISYERRIFHRGVNESFMSDVDPARSDIKVDQESGKGYAIEAGYFGDIYTFNYKISVAYEYWSIEDSETAFDGVDTLIEPKNSTNAVTFTVGLFF